MENLSMTMQRNHSQQWLDQAERVIPGGVNSPARAFAAVGGNPRFIASAHGAYLTDVDGRRYIDYVGAFGPMILGHTYPSVVEAVQQAATHGFCYGAPSPLEVELAELICQRLPNIEQIRLVSSGTEAAMTAVRLVRAVTGRDKIIKFAGCYHGHADSFLVEAGSGALTLGQPSSPGVPAALAEMTLNAEYNNLDSVSELLEKYNGQIAAIFVEPIAANMNLLFPELGFLEGLRTLCDQYHCLLVFDEVITGFRVGPQGAQGLYNIKPDLTLLGKVIGGGLPVGAVGGRRDLMQQLAPVGPVFQAGTLSGCPLAMAAGLATLKELTESSYQQLETTTAALVNGLCERAQAANIPLCGQYGCGLFGLFFTEEPQISRYSQVLRCDRERFTRFFQGLLSKGVYLAPSNFEAGFISLAHGAKEISATLQAAEEVLRSL